MGVVTTYCYLVLFFIGPVVPNFFGSFVIDNEQEVREKARDLSHSRIEERWMMLTRTPSNHWALHASGDTYGEMLAKLDDSEPAFILMNLLNDSEETIMYTYGITWVPPNTPLMEKKEVISDVKFLLDALEFPRLLKGPIAENREEIQKDAVVDKLPKF